MTSETKPTSRFPWRCLAASLLLALAAGAGGYAAGALPLQDALDTCRADQVTAQAACDHELASSETLHRASLQTIREHALATEDRLALFEVRRDLQLVADQIESLNFGTAEQKLRAVDQRLQGMVARQSDLQSLSTRVNATQLLVAADISAQRNVILGFAHELDALIDGP